ncbi:nitric oxide dioxygenase [Hathewaya proteolytica DSM 3090]|uniref:nitric oxide dioxygenase n=1 Tax=Hathewaya proteolytica DSM 3090 TaxID=1121331 RepID=A0A1M6QKM7_9CLOT|nr:FAD-binding oxidoreductase [Hathewaya proteolytica]SHK20801.1 nitric oxide dioxygenase [Hathewaya proteolytica DSM 3090]
MMWQGFKELVLTDKIRENKEVTSFYFKAVDGGKLQLHKPGQFLPIDVNSKDEKYKSAMRTYSLSMKPNEEIYRISVKKVEGGLISTYLTDEFKVGDVIKALPPTGKFVLNENSNKPLVLLSGGIGITPLLSMLYEAVNSKREIIFVQAVQNSSVQTFGDDIKNLQKYYGNLKSIVFYSKPLPEDIVHEDYDFEGYLTEQWIKDNLPWDGDFYFCGPPPFMSNIENALKAMAVKEENINFEFFGSGK